MYVSFNDDSDLQKTSIVVIARSAAYAAYRPSLNRTHTYIRNLSTAECNSQLNLIVHPASRLTVDVLGIEPRLRDCESRIFTTTLRHIGRPKLLAQKPQAATIT